MRIAIVIAMDVEYNCMLQAIGGHSHGTFNGHDITLYHSGIGKVNAALGTVQVINEARPDCILNTGLAGAVSPDLNLRQVVLGQRVAYHDVYCGPDCLTGQVQGMPQYFEGNQQLIDIALSTNKPGQPKRTVEGLVCTGDQFITKLEEVQSIAAKFPEALVCEMEAAAIAHTCYLYGVPFLSIRVVSDTPGRTADHNMQWQEFLASMGDHSFQWMRTFLSSIPSNFRLKR